MGWPNTKLTCLIICMRLSGYIYMLHLNQWAKFPSTKQWPFPNKTKTMKEKYTRYEESKVKLSRREYGTMGPKKTVRNYRCKRKSSSGTLLCATNFLLCVSSKKFSSVFVFFVDLWERFFLVSHLHQLGVLVEII